MFKQKNKKKLPVGQNSHVKKKKKLPGSAQVWCRVDNSSGRSLSLTLVGRAVSDTETVRLYTAGTFCVGRGGGGRRGKLHVQPPYLWINKAAVLFTHLTFLLFSCTGRFQEMCIQFVRAVF